MPPAPKPSRPDAFASESAPKENAARIKEVENALRNDLKLRFEGERDYKFKDLSGPSLTLLAEEIVKSGGNANAKVVDVGLAIGQMANFVQGWAIVSLIESPSARPLLVGKPQMFADIASEAEFGSLEIFRLFLNQKTADWMSSGPKKAMGELKALSEKYGPSALSSALQSPAIAALYLDEPAKFESAFSYLREKFGDRAHWVCQSFENERVAEYFLANPKKAVDAFYEARSVLEKNKLEAWDIQSAFIMFGKSEQAFAKFLSNPSKMAKAVSEIVAVFENDARHVLDALENRHMFAWFDSQPGEFKAAISSLFQAIGSRAASEFLSESTKSPAIGKWFTRDPATASEVIRRLASGKDESFATGIFTALGNESIAGSFLADPDKFIRSMERLQSDLRGSFGTYEAMRLIRTARVAELFAADPDATIDMIMYIDRGMGRERYSVLGSFAEHGGAFFAENQAEIKKIVGTLGEHSFFILKEMAEVGGYDAKEVASAIGQIAEKIKYGAVFRLFANEGVSSVFLSDPTSTLAALEAANRAFGDNAYELFPLLADKRPDLFVSFCRNGMGADELSFNLTVLNAPEIGRKLDEMHELPTPQRAQYIRENISQDNLLALLVSDPQLFYTSTNHLLMDRLWEIRGKAKTTTDLLGENKIAGGAFERNLIFRSMAYGRFSGGEKPMFTNGEMNSLLPTLFSPIKEEGFNQTYMYLLANNLKAVADSGLGQEARERLEAAKANPNNDYDSVCKRKAAEFLLGYLGDYLSDKKIDSPKYGSSFNASNFKDSKGVINMVQVFDKQDTQEYHWGETKRMFSAYGPGVETTDASGTKVTYEFTKGKQKFRVTLFMGEDAQKNRDFTRKELSEHKNAILTFRGHSFSLAENMPSNIFDNKEGNILFIPGSCGSAQAIPDYIKSNPNTNLAFISNTSTGRGNVTNAILGLLIDQAALGKPTEYNSLLNKGEGKIASAGGDRKTLQASMLGEIMLRSLYGVQKAKTEFY